MKKQNHISEFKVGEIVSVQGYYGKYEIWNIYHNDEYHCVSVSNIFGSSILVHEHMLRKLSINH